MRAADPAGLSAWYRDCLGLDADESGVWRQEEGLTVLLVEQKLPFARRVASEFCVLDKGRRVASGDISELTDEVVKEYLSV